MEDYNIWRRPSLCLSAFLHNRLEQIVFKRPNKEKLIKKNMLGKISMTLIVVNNTSQIVLNVFPKDVNNLEIHDLHVYPCKVILLNKLENVQKPQEKRETRYKNNIMCTHKSWPVTGSCTIQLPRKCSAPEGTVAILSPHLEE